MILEVQREYLLVKTEAKKKKKKDHFNLFHSLANQISHFFLENTLKY